MIVIVDQDVGFQDDPEVIQTPHYLMRHTW